MANQLDPVSPPRRRVQSAHTMTKSHIMRPQSGKVPHKIADVAQRQTYPSFATKRMGYRIETNECPTHVKRCNMKREPNTPNAYLIERLDFGVHNEWELAQFTGIRFRRCQPLLQTGLMNIFQATGTITWRQQWILRIAFAMAYSTNVAAVLWCLTAAWPKSVRMKQNIPTLAIWLYFSAFFDAKYKITFQHYRSANIFHLMPTSLHYPTAKRLCGRFAVAKNLLIKAVNLFYLVWYATLNID